MCVVKVKVWVNLSAYSEQGFSLVCVEIHHVFSQSLSL